MEVIATTGENSNGDKNADDRKNAVHGEQRPIQRGEDRSQDVIHHGGDCCPWHVTDDYL